ncbi:MAG: histidine ammonia-lyase [Bacilli bacterium]|nr:histidine ammonia-lyase [Bacilli bacterium]
MEKTLFINGENLNYQIVSDFIEGKYSKVDLTEQAWKKVENSNEIVKKIVERKKPVYGITTGFGSFADIVISKEDTEKLQENLIISHAAGVGEPFEENIVRLIMLFRANALSKGFSGIYPTTLKLLLELINKNITPYVPKYGSVGASGDLAPLSHIALTLIGLGKAFYKGELIDSKKALSSCGLKEIRLKAKEGLALNNGTQMMSACGYYALYKFERLIKTAIVTASMSVEGLLGSTTPFKKEIHDVRPHYGQKKVAKLLFDILSDSDIVNSHKDCSRVQDAYTLRCIPQVYGACLDVWKHVEKVFEIEINSATDNPLIFSEEDVFSGGNFHGEPVALNLDFLAMAVSEIGNMSERRTDRLLNNPSNKVLPAFLTQKGGLNSGLMIAQYTSAALVTENKILCHPASVDSIPTSANQEDHVSMGSISAVKIQKIIENLENILSIELMCAFNAVKFHKGINPSSVSKKVINELEKEISVWDYDRIMYMEIEKVKKVMKSEGFLKILNNMNI